MSLSREAKEMLQKAIEKMAKEYITAEESRVTDFHIKVNGENGDVTVSNDEGCVLARVHILEWENVHDEQLFEKELRNILVKMQKQGLFDNLNIAKPYSFVLTDDEDLAYVDLLIVDDDTLVLSESLLEGFDEEMNQFLKHLLEE